MNNTGTTYSNVEWFRYNSDPKFPFLHPNPKQFIRNLERQKRESPYDHLLNFFRIDFKTNSQRLDVVRSRRLKSGPRTNRLAFPVLGKYTTYKDVDTFNFYIELGKICEVHGLFEPRLLVNHAHLQGWRSKIIKNDNYITDLKIPDDYCNIWHDFNRWCIKQAVIELVKFNAHKNTTPGPPFCFANGTFYQKEDVLYGHSFDMENVVQIALRKDYSAIKKTFLPVLEDIHFQQVYFAEKGLENISAEIIALYLGSIQPVGVLGDRFNNIDKVNNISSFKQVNLGTKCYTKDRNVCMVLPGESWFGVLNNQLFTDYCNEINNSPANFADQRPRDVVNVGWASQTSATVNSKMITQFIEHSVNGFASTSNNVISSYSKFLEFCRYENKQLMFINGDRSNAETFVTSNYEQFRKLIPPEVRRLYDFQDNVLILDYEKNFEGREVFNPYFVTGLPSGMGRTTELNWYMGTFEAMYVISRMTRTNIADVLKNYLQSVINCDDFFRIKDFNIKLFMPTDDIPMVIGGNLDKLDMSFLKEADDRKMEWNVSYDKMSTFGMTFSSEGLTPNEVSVVAKLFYSEHPGFYVQDCFSISSKMDMLPRELRLDIDKLLHKMWPGTNSALYKQIGNAFLGWLESYGIPITAAVDSYSPSGKIIYGNLVDSDNIHQSSRVSEVYFKKIFEYYKGVYHEPEIFR